MYPARNRLTKPIFSGDQRAGKLTVQSGTSRQMCVHCGHSGLGFVQDAVIIVSARLLVPDSWDRLDHEDHKVEVSGPGDRSLGAI